MHGLPCGVLQHCFGSNADVSAEPTTPRAASETRTGAAAAVAVQPGPRETPESPCSSDYAKFPNGTSRGSSCRGDARVNGGHASEDSYSAREAPGVQDGVLQHGNPDLRRSYSHIPRPSIIRQEKDSVQQAEPTDGPRWKGPGQEEEEEEEEEQESPSGTETHQTLPLYSHFCPLHLSQLLFQEKLFSIS
ncbi:hypothetical protein GN956_G3673 [Arapaima gigas]